MPFDITVYVHAGLSSDTKEATADVHSERSRFNLLGLLVGLLVILLLLTPCVLAAAYALYSIKAHPGLATSILIIAAQAILKILLAMFSGI